MPPKAKKEEPKPLSKKAKALQAAMSEAVSGAQQLYKQHEIQRVRADGKDKGKRDLMFLDEAIERERLKAEQLSFQKLVAEFARAEELTFINYKKHREWEDISYSSRLPDAHNEADTNAFLGEWVDQQNSFEHYNPNVTVLVSTVDANKPSKKLTFIRGEQCVLASKRQQIIGDELQRCFAAYELTERIKESRDIAANRSFPYGALLDKVYEQVLCSFNFITVMSLLYYDTVIDSSDGETLMRVVPAKSPVIKFGLWVKVKETTRSFTSLSFPDVEIRLDPKQNSLPRLPKMLGLSKENIAVRVVQLAFDPYSSTVSRGKQYYALNCTLKVDLIGFSERPHRTGDWLMRGETAESHVLQIENYPPNSTEARTEDPGLRISFEIPQNLVVRQPSLFIGKWNVETREWEPCSHAILGASFGPAARVEPNPRRATFTVSELAQFAVLHETVHDAPYECWSLKPMSSESVLCILEGRHRGDATDREFRILIEGARCRLLAPDDPELGQLHTEWHEPAILFRELKQAGFNFLLVNEDSIFLENIVPKSVALEEKAYRDIAQFAQTHTFASSCHNKGGEDPDMALFRVSRKWLQPDEEDDSLDIPAESSEWYSIRYRSENCVLASFQEQADNTDLNILPGSETHFNLHYLLASLDGEEAVRGQIVSTNYLLRRCIYELLCLIRPLSWS